MANFGNLLILIAGCSTAMAMAAPGAEFATTEEGIIGTYRKTVPDVDFETAKAQTDKVPPKTSV